MDGKWFSLTFLCSHWKPTGRTVTFRRHLQVTTMSPKRCFSCSRNMKVKTVWGMRRIPAGTRPWTQITAVTGYSKQVATAYNYKVFLSERSCVKQPLWRWQPPCRRHSAPALLFLLSSETRSAKKDTKKNRRDVPSCVIFPMTSE